ncbi:MAG: hypothetical protein UR23_C0033G0006 [Candidatus Roizmanbacteria bacterium GW2011_GWA2_32_13]|uniref:N-acetyltransferase domain-containing protein n=1 Tax=Candidatus Roizmanbacteria bacterium GW2011_GWA2_32_13 TaxID=1618475 RepID=A0A0F9YU95_9BACT|nr:MAG: hypothetical protein UR23_C0033G0006 [Candidatus Roizmanbacteria bacterium GW2011_GWA2_32_13]
MNKGNKILLKIKKIKSLPFGKTAIKCVYNNQKYQLILITSDCVENRNIVRLLARWRKKHQSWFQAQFKVTTKRTKIWLEKKVIETPDRLLFLIRINNNFIGHMGFFRFNFKNYSCEIDNVVRGEPGYPGIIQNGLKYLMEWGKKNLFIENYTLETTSDNQRAINLYSKLGFSEFKRIPLIQTDKNGYNEWIGAPKNYKEEIKRYNLFMKIKK